MKALIFDSGPIITLTLNGLLWTLKDLKEHYKGKFYITKAVKEEIVDHPLQTKKFKFEAFQVLKEIREGTLEVYDSAFVRKETPKLMKFANGSYTIKKHPLPMLHYAEVSAIAAAIELDADALVVDERMTRLFLERPGQIDELIKKRYHATPAHNAHCYKSFREHAQHIAVIRSAELMSRAFELGIINEYVAKSPAIPYAKEQLLDGLLWGLKLNGCALSEKEIKQLLKIQRRR